MRGCRHLIPLLGLLSAACADLNEPAPVAIGDESFTLSDLRRIYSDIEPAKRPPLDTRDQRVAFVDRWIDRHLLRAYGEEMLPGEAGVREELARAREEILVRRLRVMEAAGRRVTSDDVAAAHHRMGRSSLVERILFRSEEDARQARERIAPGDDFSVPAAWDVPSHAFAPEWVTWAPHPDPIADTAAELEIGEISEPIDVGGGWVLVRVKDRKALRVSALEDATTLLTRGLHYRHSVETDREFGEKLRQEAAVRIDPNVVDRLSRLVAEAILAPGATENDADWAVPRLSPDEEALAVAVWKDGGAWTAGEYRDQLHGMVRAQRPRNGPLVDAVGRQVEAGVTRRLYVEEAERRGLDEDHWVRSSFASARDDLLVGLAIDAIRRRSTPSEAEIDSLTALLRRSAPDFHRSSQTARVLRYDFSSREAALLERERIVRAGGGLARLAEIVTGDLQFEGAFHIVNLTPDGVGDPDLRRAIFEDGPGVLGGPSQLAGAWALAECLERTPAAEVTAESIRERVRRQLSEQRQADFVAEWVSARRAEVGVRVDVEALDGLAPGG